MIRDKVLFCVRYTPETGKKKSIVKYERCLPAEDKKETSCGGIVSQGR